MIVRWIGKQKMALVAFYYVTCWKGIRDGAVSLIFGTSGAVHLVLAITLIKVSITFTGSTRSSGTDLKRL